MIFLKNINRLTRLSLPIFFSLAVLSSCGTQQSSVSTADSSSVATATTFVMPTIPAMLTTPEDRAAYLVANYWTNFNFKDTSLISRPEITEQALADFINILPHVPSVKASKAVKSLMVSAEVDSAVFAHFMTITELYLNDPNSPMRNEELYIPVLEYLISDSKLDEISKIRPKFQLEMALKNRPGNLAADFVYTLASGKTGRMMDVKADFTILFFNNPDCTDCKRVKEMLAVNLAKTEPSKIRVLALYPDEDLDLWRKTEYPAGWINAHDKSRAISSDQLYNLKAIPTLYLLDKDKRVVLKDAPVESILDYFAQHNML